VDDPRIRLLGRRGLDRARSPCVDRPSDAPAAVAALIGGQSRAGSAPMAPQITRGLPTMPGLAPTPARRPLRSRSLEGLPQFARRQETLQLRRCGLPKRSVRLLWLHRRVRPRHGLMRRPWHD